MTASAQTIREFFLLDRLGKFLFRQELLIPVVDDHISVQPSKTDSTTIGISNLLVIKLTDFLVKYHPNSIDICALGEKFLMKPIYGMLYT